MSATDRLQLQLSAPVSGRVLPLESVPDPVFAQKIVGDGIAIDPTSQILLAPCAGKIVQLHSSHHALTIATEHGTQILLHIGLDTVQLKGEGFNPLVSVGQNVRAQQKLIEFDADLIAQRNKPLITVMVVTGESQVQRSTLTRAEAGKDLLLTVSEGVPTATNSTGGSYAESDEIEICLPTGLHARPAALLVNLAKTFQSKIEIFNERKIANAKSVVSLLAMEVTNGEKLRFLAQGLDARAAVTALASFLSELREAPHSQAPAQKFPEQQRTSSDPNLIFGVAVSPGIAMGRIRQIHVRRFVIEENAKGGAKDELVHLHTAIAAAVGDLKQLSATVKAQTDASRAAIFSAHQELLEDPEILEDTQAEIARGKSAAFAWDRAIRTQADLLANLNNELMANRANDLLDAGQRVLSHLAGEPSCEIADLPSGTILVAENLTPSQTAMLNREKIFAFCTVSGGATSHVAILARSLGLPALAGMDPRILQLPEGSEVILDGDQGEIRIHPSPEDKVRAAARQQEQLEKRRAALALAQQEAHTSDGVKIEVAANIGSLADAKEALAAGADGLGLLRSEFLFLDRDTAPSEEEQLAIYQQIADLWPEKNFVIRTLDVGGDKPLRYLPLPHEENPFLGIRGIRIGLLHEDILRTQLRAILRVKTLARVHIMFPMISTLAEWRRAKMILEEERAKLGRAPVAVGIMVEVPSTALLAEQFAREADFFSIGTNDLTQYTLAMDRGHKDLAKQADALHPSVLQLIELTCRAAKAHGRWVGVCGGLAGESKAVPILIGLGVRELSVSIPAVPLIKSNVREVSIAAASALAQRALQCSSGEEIRELKNKGYGNVRNEVGVHVSAENR